jgi:2-dehydro-3-deoxy-D-arabinonate dehydratase
MKFSVLHTSSAQYQFAVTVDGVHRTVEGLPTLTEAMHLTLAELKARTSDAQTTITGHLAPPIAPEI